MGSDKFLNVPHLSKLEVTQHLQVKVQNQWPQITTEILAPEQPDEIQLHLTIEQAETADAALPQELKISPDNLYTGYLEDPSTLDQLCQSYIDAIQDIINIDEKTETILLPVIQNQSWLASIEAGQQPATVAEHSPIASIPLVADLVIVFALKQGHASLFATEDTLQEFVEAEVIHQSNLMAMEMGIENLRSMAGDVKVENTDVGYRIHLDSTFDTSLIMIYDEWKHLLSLKGAPVFALLARGTLIVADGANQQQVQALKAYAKEKVKQSSYPLSADLYTFRGNHLVPHHQVLH